MVIRKSDRELALMREAGRIVAITHAQLEDRIRPGVTTAELDALAHETVTRLDATPAFLGYRGFPASLCVAINEEVVHGIPGPRVLEEGDIVSMDFGAIYRGYHGDAAVTVGVGKISQQAQELIDTARGALEAGIAQARKGSYLGDISWAIQNYAESRDFSVVRQYVGHGIGRDMHEDPQIPNYGQPGRGIVLKPGMTFALEPMVNIGTYLTQVLEDDWTVVTDDGELSAHFEHTIAVTDGEPEILTRLWESVRS
ncbi:MAG: type I methionyl aminopeptidase [Anaerolineae bacterium]|nr:type I methionyl aminopeptidase [Anaerolineae bacterium]NIN97891.1 type I methionyl aminopeptidase [Anaerolineae bacterium]NIQ80870.1 type I methionyl aminopeptidase [Anaerolineae bacterium]